MKFALKESEYQFVQDNLITPLKTKGVKVYIFGSRVTGRNHPYSDVDILLDGDYTPEVENLIVKIKFLFEESNFPYKIDLVRLCDLAQSYRDNVLSSRVEV